METLIYLDSNIYIDYFDNRTDYLRPLGEFAFELIRRAISCEFKIIFSGVAAEELEYNGCSEQLSILLKRLKECDKLIFVEGEDADFQEARKLAHERDCSFNDALHAVLAHKTNAAYLVTRNIKHLQKFSDMARIVYPENI